MSRAGGRLRLDQLLTGRNIGQADRVYETYWTTMRGVEVMDNNYALMDLTVYGRPIAQWSRIEAGRDDDLSGARSATS